jgi:hypothetical protein
MEDTGRHPFVDSLLFDWARGALLTTGTDVLAAVRVIVYVNFLPRCTLHRAGMDTPYVTTFYVFFLPLALPPTLDAAAELQATLKAAQESYLALARTQAEVNHNFTVLRALSEQEADDYGAALSAAMAAAKGKADYLVRARKENSTFAVRAMARRCTVGWFERDRMWLRSRLWRRWRRWWWWWR